MKITKYHFFLIAIVLITIVISEIKYDRYWENQLQLVEIENLDLLVTDLHVNHAALSFNDSIKASSFQFELIDTIIKDFDWINFETPFQIIKEEGSDTLRLVQKDGNELKFKIK